MTIPEYQGLDPNQIVNAGYLFDSAWHIHRSLAWLDYAKRTTGHQYLRYVAIELRAGIELLWFEILVISVGGILSAKNYAECSRKSTEMYKLIDKLTPGYEKLLEFTRITLTLEPNGPESADWDMSKLKRFHGEASSFLHFQGAPKDTFETDTWLIKSLSRLEEMALYIWGEMTSHHGTGIVPPQRMQPEVHSIWEQFRDGKINEDSVRIQLNLARPILAGRRRLL